MKVKMLGRQFAGSPFCNSGHCLGDPSGHSDFIYLFNLKIIILFI